MKISVFKNCHWQNIVVLSLLVLLISVSTVFGMSDASTGKKGGNNQVIIGQPLPTESPSTPTNINIIDTWLEAGVAYVQSSGRITKKSCIKGISCTLEFNADIEYPNGCRGQNPKGGACSSVITYGKLRLSKLPSEGSYSTSSRLPIFIDNSTGEKYIIK